MMIRDLGANVEFWINSNNTQTYNYQMPWAYVVNGVTSGWQYYRYTADSGWQRLGVWNVTTTQTVTFKLGATGTIGLGGPTTFSHLISRATIPAAPNQPTLSAITLDSIKVSWTPNSNGGSTITAYQVGYGTSSSAPTTTVTATSPYTATNLAMGTVYYFWVRAKNSVGWSAWSKLASARTYLGVYVNVGGAWKLAIPYVKVAGVWKQAQPYALHTTPLQGGSPPQRPGGYVPA
jgi:hypothetical protein